MQNAQMIFSSVPSRNYLPVYGEANKLDYKQAVELMDLHHKDIANATNTPIKSVRFDSRIPMEVAKRIEEWVVLLELVAEFFEGNVDKAILWFRTPNYLLGNISPRDMIRFGRYKKLMKYVQNALAGNQSA